MARKCEMCGKGPQVGSTVSHAHNVNKRRFLPNLQSVNAIVDGKKRRIRVCSTCIKSGRVIKA